MKRPLTHLSVFLVTALTLPAFCQQIITTVAGGGPGDNTPATSAALGCPCSITANASGVVYLSSASRNRVFKVDLSGKIFTVAGSDLWDFSGDGGPATSATFRFPAGIAFDIKGNLYIADGLNNRVRKVDTSGIISTVAGNGTGGFSGDGGPAVNAELRAPRGVTIHGGNLYIADSDNARIRKVDSSGKISTVAGNGTAGFSGDGGPAINAELYLPSGVTFLGKNLFIADLGNQRIRKVDSAGTISTVAGNGIPGYSGDGGPATSAELAYPSDVTAHGGNLYIADTYNQRIRKVGSAGKISTVAGNGTAGYSGDGGPATSAMLYFPTAVSVDGSGNLYIADEAFPHMRKVNTSGIISTSAGNGEFDFSGDSGPATNAQFFSPYSVAADNSGNLYIVDTFNERIRKVDASGLVTTVAGNGVYGFSGDGGPATAAELSNPRGLAVDSHGNLYIADTESQRIRKVDASGIISTIAGRGHPGFGGDGGPATQAVLRNPIGVAVDGNGNIYIADEGNRRIRKVDASGIISTVAQSNGIVAVAVDNAGNVYIADAGHFQLRKLDTSGTLTTIAGNGTRGFSGDGGPATSAELSGPAGVAVDSAGNIYIADSYPTYLGDPGTGNPENDRVRRIDPSGIISTVSGNGTIGFSGDGGPAPNAELAFPNGLAVDSSRNLYITDTRNNRVRKLTAAPHADTEGGK